MRGYELDKNMDRIAYFFSLKKVHGVRAVMKNKWPKSDEKTGFGGTLGLALSLWPSHSKIGGDATGYLRRPPRRKRR